MEFVSFEEFIHELQLASAWTLEMKIQGLILTIPGKGTGPVRQFCSPNPIEVRDIYWRKFANQIGHVIDMKRDAILS